MLCEPVRTAGESTAGASRICACQQMMPRTTALDFSANWRSDDATADQGLGACASLNPVSSVAARF